MNDPRPGGVKNLTEFGQWFTLLTRLLDTNPTQIAKRARVGRATVAELLYPKADGQAVRPDTPTLAKLWEAIQLFAIERSGNSLSDGYRIAFWYAGKRGNPSDEEQANARLQEIILVVALLERKNSLIVELRRENSELSKRRRRRSK